MTGKVIDWDLAASKVQFGINTTVNTTTGKTAAQILLGVRMKSSSDNILREVLYEADDTKDKSEIRTRAKAAIDDKQNKMRDVINSSRNPARKYNINDLVKLTKVSFNENIGESKKLLPKFTGPYKVSNVLGNDRYEICNIPGFAKTKKYSTIVAADRMRPWINIKALDVESDDSVDTASDA